MHEISFGTQLAEGFAIPPCGVPLEYLSSLILPESGRCLHRRHLMKRFDNKLLPVISSAHLACGLHSGDPLTIRRTIEKLNERNVQIGAHPSYPDLFSFGLEPAPVTVDELVSVLLYQFGALGGVLAEFGLRVAHVKCHGALAYDVAYQEQFCAALIKAIKIFDPSMALVALSGSPSVGQARAAGVKVVEEAYLDRRYDAQGRLVPRNHPNGVIKCTKEAVQQLIGIVNEGIVTAVDGTRVPLQAKAFCLHSDTPSVGVLAKALIKAVCNEGIQIKPISALAA